MSLIGLKLMFDSYYLTRSFTQKKQKCLQTMLILPLQGPSMKLPWCAQYSIITRQISKDSCISYSITDHLQLRQNIRLHRPLIWSIMTNLSFRIFYQSAKQQLKISLKPGKTCVLSRSGIWDMKIKVNNTSKNSLCHTEPQP